MPNNNVMQLMQMFKASQNPQQMILGLLQNQMGSSPLGANLLKLAQNNQTAEIEQIARNVVQSQGKDFDKEFNAFRQMLGL